MDKLYNCANLDGEEVQYKPYFEKLVYEFGADCDIYVRKEDFGRMLAAGVVNRFPQQQVAVTIYLKYGALPISNPLNPSVIERVKNHFKSSSSEDLVLNSPVRKSTNLV